MKKGCNFICTIMLLFVPIFCLAENQFIFVGRVIDSFTGEPLKGVRITVMDKDSVQLASGMTTGDVNQNCELFNIKGQRGMFILKYEFQGYETAYHNRYIGNTRTNYFNLDEVKMKRLPKMLGDAKITATKIKMIIRKDTIVYNADAFQLAEGSMLDDLIRLLPGVTLKNNGQIWVNGKFVSSLLVNGNDFFDGDPGIALKNLPSYIVDKIKIYEKSQANAYLTQPDSTAKKPLVMDVLLKKQYSIGWVANAEVSGGTNNKYLAKLFGLRFTNHSRLAFFSNSNNVNDTQQHSTDGDWNPAWIATGQTSLRTTGTELLINDKRGIYKQISSARFDYQNIKDYSESSSELFLQNGDIYARSRSFGRNYPAHFITNHDFSLRMKKLYLQIQPFLEYNHYKNKSQYDAANFSSEVHEAYRGALIDSLLGKNSGYFQQTMVNQNSILSKGSGHQWQAGMNFNMTFHVPREGDWVNVYGYTKYRYSSYKAFAQNDLKYASSALLNDFRNQYTETPDKDYDLKFHGIYTYKITQQFRLQPQYEFERIYRSTDRSLYRLDRYAEWNSVNGRAFGILPSTKDSLLHCMDFQNSYLSNYYSTIHIPELQFGSIQTKLFSLSARMRWRIENDRLRYSKNQNDTTLTRNYNAWIPYIWGNIWKIDYQYSHDVINADLLSMVNTRNDENPLYVYLGNSNLKNITTENVTLNYSLWNQQLQQNFSIRPSYVLWTNNVAERITYDRITGVRTYQPQNIKGNWRTSCQINYGQALDKKHFWMFATKSDVSYYNNVDFVVESGEKESSRSTVHNFGCQEEISAMYQKATYRIEFFGKVAWTNATSQRADFTTINCVDFDYGANTVISMPLKIQLSTDLAMYSRRGYDDHSMNTNDLVWNAQISRPFFKGKLVSMLEGFDILGNLSNIRRTLNAQGRTETWYNVVPRYIMLHLIYRLNIQPKKK